MLVLARQTKSCVQVLQTYGEERARCLKVLALVLLDLILVGTFEMLLTACNCYQFLSTSRHIQKYSTCQEKNKNNLTRMQVKHLLNVNNLDI